MTVADMVGILKAFDAGTLTRAQAVEAMVARGDVRDEAEFTMALHCGEIDGDVID